MTWPTTFASLSGPSQPLSLFDAMFQQVAAISTIPSSAAGINAISLTPLINNPILAAYVELCSFRFRAVGTTTGAVTAQFNGLGFLNVYHGDGVTQANLGDMIIGQEYVITYSLALNGGLGGFFLESPGMPSVVGNTYFTPGGRLTLQAATPVMVSNQLAAQTVYYAPYVHPFVPIYNGANFQMYNFTASLVDEVGLSLAMAGSASWPLGSNFDVFVTLVVGVPTLCTIQWTNATTRATALNVFGGLLTNSVTATARTGPATTINLLANQGTFLGSFATNNVAGQSIWQYGSAASGGGNCVLFISNYYNQCLFNTLVTDNGAPYTYTTNVVRVARASGTNQIAYIQASSERAAQFIYSFGCNGIAAGAQPVGGIGLTTAFNALGFWESGGLASFVTHQSVTYSVAFTGTQAVLALEQGDGVNANTFDFGSTNQLFGSIWL
jgi:hypothetical protein